MAHSSKHHAKGAPHSGARTVVITAISLVLLVALAVGVIVSPVFAMRTVSVQGEEQLTEGEVLRSGGLDGDTNVLLLSTDRIRESMLANPWIAEAHIARSLPASVSVQIRERRPVAVARAAGGYLLIAEDGTTLVATDRRGELPQIKGGSPAPPGERSDQIAGAAAAAAVFDETVRAGGPILTAEADGTISIELDGKIPVLWGDPRDPEDKAKALSGVIEWAEEERATIVSIDVRVPHAPAAELRQRGSEREAEIPLGEDADLVSDAAPRTATGNDNGAEG